MSRETKTLVFQIKATGETTVDGQEFGQIECYGAIFGNVDDGNDRINKGAFTRTIQNSKARAKTRDRKYILPILWQHDTNELIGGWYDLKEDNIGLLCKGEVALATQRGREYYALAKAGMSDQFSIIYDVPTGGAKYDKSGVRDLNELRLFSIDVVSFAMNDETRLVSVKAAKDKAMKDKPVERKSLMDHYKDGMAQDLLTDWQDVYICSLTEAVFDAFTQGDDPETAVSQALDDFKPLIMSKFVPQAMEVDLSGFLADAGYSYNPASSTMQNGSDGGYYGYMSRTAGMSSKRGAAISATNQGNIDDHVAAMKSMAKGHAKQVSDAMDSFAATMAGSKPDDEDSQDDNQDDADAKKSITTALKDLKALRV